MDRVGQPPLLEGLSVLSLLPLFLALTYEKPPQETPLRCVWPLWPCCVATPPLCCSANQCHAYSDGQSEGESKRTADGVLHYEKQKATTPLSGRVFALLGHQAAPHGTHPGPGGYYYDY